MDAANAAREKVASDAVGKVVRSVAVGEKTIEVRFEDETGFIAEVGKKTLSVFPVRWNPIGSR